MGERDLLEEVGGLFLVRKVVLRLVVVGIVGVVVWVAVLEMQAQAAVGASGVGKLVLINPPQPAPGFPVWLVMAVSVVGLGCMWGGVAGTRQMSKEGRGLGRVRRVVWRVPLERG